MGWQDGVDHYTPLHVVCTAGTFKLTVTDHENTDWPAIGTTYLFDGGITQKELNKNYEVWNSNANLLNINVGGYVSNREAFIDGVNVTWWDGSPG